MPNYLVSSSLTGDTNKKRYDGMSNLDVTIFKIRVDFLDYSAFHTFIKNNICRTVKAAIHASYSREIKTFFIIFQALKMTQNETQLYFGLISL